MNAINLFVSLVVTFVVFAIMFNYPSGVSMRWYWGSLLFLAVLAWISSSMNAASKWTSLVVLYAPMTLLVLWMMSANFDFTFVTLAILPLMLAIAIVSLSFWWKDRKVSVRKE